MGSPKTTDLERELAYLWPDGEHGGYNLHDGNENSQGLCRSELRRWPPASGVCVGQRGEEGEGGFSSVKKRERQRGRRFFGMMLKMECDASKFYSG
uniref:Uncharacterized protein n=1 Tax=Fagus sylvatica TaxID=28930 RepID=A0A2N9H184_FAGSY